MASQTTSKLYRTDRTTSQIADDITAWGADNIDAQALAEILATVLRMADEGASAADIRALIDSETAD